VVLNTKKGELIMENVYITNASFNLIFKSIKDKANITQDRETMISDIAPNNDALQNTLQTLFNDKELKRILLKKELLQNLASVFKNLMDNKKDIEEYIEKSNQTYLYSIKAPAYHIDKNCSCSYNSFHNIKFSDQLQNDPNIDKMKQWIKANSKLKFAELKKQFYTKFNLKSGLEEVLYKNTDTISLNNFDLKTLLEDIEGQYVLNQDILNDSNEKHRKQINNMKFASWMQFQKMKFKDQELADKIQQFHIYKNSINNMIFKYLKLKTNAELSFESSLLESIGFRKCQKCGTYNK